MTFLHYPNSNIGDLLSSPHRYFQEWATEKPAHITPEAIREAKGPIIIGGGGLIVNGAENWFPDISERTNPWIIWGAGTNASGNDLHLPDTLRRADLVGVRDYAPGWEWLPCASCLHPAFDKTSEPQFEFMVYSHHDHKIPIDAPVKVTNLAKDILLIVRAMLAARTVITSSYHGVYWAQLLNRRVLLFEPTTNRFEFLRYPVVRCDRTDWESKLHGPPTQPEGFLDECRQRNQDFYRRVKRLCD